ncbi:MAG: isoprenylcysteine carboxylmethyltransferase family protein [Candidatus Shapirobacteria bacterium]|nr:isoprenylcysteine carboxylmethyltransferase family protein [Candidatus Shapirobacteria bacterium]
MSFTDFFMEKENKSLILTITQAVAMVLALFTGPLISSNLFFSFLALLGLGIWIWSFVIMVREGSYNILPNLSKKNKLVTKGPYHFVRHPIYTGMFLLAGSLLLNYLTVWRIGFFLVLLFSTILKLEEEEKILNKSFEDYHQYQKKTKRLIPFVY